MQSNIFLEIHGFLAAPTALDSDNNGLAAKEGRFESLFQEDLYAKNEVPRML